MKASQMIYTACGRDMSGAFGVWAKSADVTKAECDEISKLMVYRKAANAPVFPTEEEIKQFPKKYCYHRLASGRRCIALTSYIGKVYSDLDMRSGNFIIHAYIFDALDGFNPFGAMKLDAFKTCLSYDEWHNPAPETLPVVDLEISPVVSEGDIRELLTSEKRDAYVSLLQAVIDAADSDETISFNDTEERQIKLYSLMGTLLPASFFETSTFCNQYNPQLDYTMTMGGMKPVKIRNIMLTSGSGVYDYREQLAAGQAVFDFENGICSQIGPKRYLTDIIESIERGDSLFSSLKKIDKINAIMRQTGCDVDSATAVYHLLQGELTWFSGADEYTRAFTIAAKHSFVDAAAIAVALYRDILAADKWGGAAAVPELVKYAYENNDATVKAAIMDKYFAELKTYGINASDAPDRVLASVKANAPFPWNDFSAAVVREPKWEKYADEAQSFSSSYLVFDATVVALAQGLGETEKAVGCRLMVKLVKGSLERRSADEVKAYLFLAKRLGESALSWLIESSLGTYLNGGVADEATLDFLFSVVCALDSEQEKLKLAGKLVIGNMNAPGLMQTYLKYAEAQQSLFARVESTYRSDSVFNDFLFKKEAYVFKTSTRVTFASLGAYYNKYYKTGCDDGVYLEKLKQYISPLTGKTKLTECMRIYDQFKGFDNAFADVMSVLTYLDKEIFSLTMDELLGFAPAHISAVMELNRRLIAASVGVPDKYPSLITILLLRGKFGEDACRSLIERGSVYEYFDKAGLAAFVDKYFGEVLSFYFRYKKKKLFGTDTLLPVILAAPLSSERGYGGVIAALERLSNGEYYELMADIMAYAFNVENGFGGALKSFVCRYVDTMKRGDYKKLFKKVVELMPRNAALSVQAYIDDYLSTHKSFFEKLFGKKE